MGSCCIVCRDTNGIKVSPKDNTGPSIGEAPTTLIPNANVATATPHPNQDWTNFFRTTQNSYPFWKFFDISIYKNIYVEIEMEIGAILEKVPNADPNH